MTSLCKVYTNRTIISVKEVSELRDEYIAVLKRLHGEEFSVSQQEFEILLNQPNELVTFLLVDGKLAASAQASFHYRFPHFEAFVNNVVTHSDYGGQGLGRQVMESLESAVQKEWGENGTRSINMLLSNSPAKGNGGFYEKLGWTSRGPNSTSPTVMWVKTI